MNDAEHAEKWTVWHLLPYTSHFLYAEQFQKMNSIYTYIWYLCLCAVYDHLYSSVYYIIPPQSPDCLLLKNLFSFSKFFTLCQHENHWSQANNCESKFISALQFFTVGIFKANNLFGENYNWFRMLWLGRRVRFCGKMKFLCNFTTISFRVAQNHKAVAKICPIVKFRTFLESLDHSTSVILIIFF